MDVMREIHFPLIFLLPAIHAVTVALPSPSLQLQAEVSPRILQQPRAAGSQHHEQAGHLEISQAASKSVSAGSKVAFSAPARTGALESAL